MTNPLRSADVIEYEMYIDGSWVPGREREVIPSIDPFTNQVWARFPRATAADVDDAVSAARRALEGPWGSMTGTERGRLIRRFAELARLRGADLARVESRDNGKPLKEMTGQLELLPDWLQFFAGAADKIYGATIPVDKANFLVYTRNEPVGVVAAITPWNSPILLLASKLAPALAPGCVLVVKPAEQATASTLELARVFDEAGFPTGVLNVVTGDGSVGQQLVRHPGVDKVAFTGSTDTGKSIMRDAADGIRKVTLELGGKSPHIVFDDADLADVVNGVVAGVFAGAGQTCLAGARLYVHESVHDELVSRLVDAAAAITLGDPLLMETEVGPVVSAEQHARVTHYLERGVAEGAKLVAGGNRPSREDLKEGFFIEPTIFTEVSQDMTIAREEIFGPVLCVLKFTTEDEVVALANDSNFGLAAGIWTQQIHRAHRVAHALRVGTVWINAYRTVSYAVPFGGMKESGIGRENGVDSIREYLEPKAVWVELSGAPRDPFKYR